MTAGYKIKPRALLSVGAALSPLHPLTGEEVRGGGLQAGAGPPHLLHFHLLLPRALVLIIQASKEEAVKTHLEVGQDEERDGRAGEGRINKGLALSSPTATPSEHR